MPYEATFRLLTPVAMVERKDFVVSSRKLLEFDSITPVPLLMGEWCTLDSVYKLDRAGNPGVPPGPWCLFAELGRSDTQGIAEGKAPVLFQNSYWAETKIFAGHPVLGAPLEVANVSYPAGVTRSGLQTHGVGTNPVIGYVTKVDTDNGGWLQFQQCMY